MIDGNAVMAFPSRRLWETDGKRGLIVGIVLGAVLPGSLSGIPMGMRNLGEGLMYLIPYAYWQNHRA